MALFQRKKKAEAKSVKEPKATKIVVKADAEEGVSARVAPLDRASILLRPHVTEKATALSEKNVYAFEVAMSANKQTVKEAIEKLYKVKPLKIAIVRRRAKTMRNPRTGETHMKTRAMKKALVYLRAGDKIEFV